MTTTDIEVTVSLRQLAEAVLDRHPTESPHDLTERLLDDVLLEGGLLLDLARRGARELLDHLHRERVRQIEQEAAYALNVTQWEKDPSCAPLSSAIYKEWVATTDEGREHDIARKQAKKEAEQERAERHRLMVEEPEEYDRQYGFGAISGLISEYRQSVRVELLQELLDSSFALGNGERVTWGAATTTEHRLRIELLMRNVTGNMQAIARHEQAISMIEEAGVHSLNELVKN